MAARTTAEITDIYSIISIPDIFNFNFIFFIVLYYYTISISNDNDDGNDGNRNRNTRVVAKKTFAPIEAYLEERNAARTNMFFCR